MAQIAVPKVYREFQDHWTLHKDTYLDIYQQGQHSFVPNLLPEQAVQLSAEDTLRILRARLGDALDVALDPAHTDPDNLPAITPEAIRSPVAHRPDGEWLKQTNMVGINVRTIGSFWNIVKYSLTLPAVQDSIHILPIWEAGVVGSIYGMSSWELNREFYSPELAAARPELDTPGRQLRAVINLLHTLGKSVGMDVIPHTDRFSEIALAYPHYFEWLQRQDTVIVDHRENLHAEVQEKILAFLARHGPAVADEQFPTAREAFFSDDLVPEARRLRILFGRPEDEDGRAERRKALVKYLYQYGYEPVPGTMAPPFRGIEVDTRAEARIVDSEGLAWRDYLITEPQSMSRVFGPLGRYKLYARRDDNRNWEIDFSRPRTEVWEYVCQKYHAVQRRYGFDFMRGDMSHVQMRPAGVPETLDQYYDILGSVKNYIRAHGAAYFGYFAETFLAPRDIMTYGDEVDHLEASGAETTLGDLQSTVVGSPVFLQRFRQYYDLLETRACVPCFTVMTGDKDDPRFDEFYVKGNEVRLFIAFFLADMPSYMGLGFETRDVHYGPAPNEHYTKLYVFQEQVGPKATHGPYVWGRNGFLYRAVTRLKLYADGMFAQVEGRPTRWLLHPDPTGEKKVIAWTQADGIPDFLFVANLDIENAAAKFGLLVMAGVASQGALTADFSTAEFVPAADRTLPFNGKHYLISRLAPGEGRVYRVGA